MSNFTNKGCGLNCEENRSDKRKKIKRSKFRLGPTATGRISAMLFEEVDSKPLSCEVYRATMEAVYSYLSDASFVPGENVDGEIYELMKEEIDLSEQRSVKARERARLRKENKAAGNTVHSVECSVTSAAPYTDAARKPNPAPCRKTNGSAYDSDIDQPNGYANASRASASRVSCAGNTV